MQNEEPEDKPVEKDAQEPGSPPLSVALPGANDKQPLGSIPGQKDALRDRSSNENSFTLFGRVIKI